MSKKREKPIPIAKTDVIACLNENPITGRLCGAQVVIPPYRRVACPVCGKIYPHSKLPPRTTIGIRVCEAKRKTKNKEEAPMLSVFLRRVDELCKRARLLGQAEAYGLSNDILVAEEAFEHVLSQFLEKYGDL